jgi:hypothetical protein
MTNYIIIIAFILIFLIILIVIIKKNTSIEKTGLALDITANSLAYKNTAQEKKVGYKDINNYVGKIGSAIATFF